MEIPPYTTTEAVRGALGVTHNEMTDAMLLDQQMGLELEVDLQQWVPTHATLYAAGKASTATDSEKLQAAYIELYAQWFIAISALSAMRLAIPQMITDGKSEMRRFQTFDFEAVERQLRSRAAKYKSQLEDSLNVSSTTSTTLAVGGVPDYDPVSGP